MSYICTKLNVVDFFLYIYLRWDGEPAVDDGVQHLQTAEVLDRDGHTGAGGALHCGDSSLLLLHW